MYFINCELSKKFYRFCIKFFLTLKNCESWRGKHPYHEGFSKEDKEALNVIVFLILVPIFMKEHNISCHTVGFPLLVLRRLIIKYSLWDAKPENKAYFKERIPNFDEKVNNYAFGKCSDNTSYEFTSWLFDAESKIDPKTRECYDIAKAIATLVEFEEVEDEIRSDVKEETKARVYESIGKYIPNYPFIKDIIEHNGEYSELLDLLHSLSWARYTFRWQNYSCPVKCSILTHMLESAILGYFMFIEEHLDELRNSDAATTPELYHGLEKAFTVMLFHDIAEIWTDDIPSPAKDGLGIREAAEEQELLALDEHFYAKLPKHVQDYFKAGIMLEDEANKASKAFYKAADYFSADLEIIWNIRDGGRDERFWKVLNKSCRKDYRTPIGRETLEFYIEQFKDIKFFE